MTEAMQSSGPTKPADDKGRLTIGPESQRRPVTPGGFPEPRDT